LIVLKKGNAGAISHCQVSGIRSSQDTFDAQIEKINLMSQITPFPIKFIPSVFSIPDIFAKTFSITNTKPE